MVESKQGSTDMFSVIVAVIVRSCHLQSLLASRMDTPSPTTHQRGYLKANCTSSRLAAGEVIYCAADCHSP